MFKEFNLGNNRLFYPRNFIGVMIRSCPVLLSRTITTRSHILNRVVRMSSISTSGLEASMSNLTITKPIPLYVTAKDTVSISYYLYGINNMSRSLDECMSSTFRRFAINYGKISKKVKGAISTPSAQEVPKLYFQGEVLDENTLTNRDWKTGMVLKYHGLNFVTVLDVPTISHIAIYPSGSTRVGAPVLAVLSDEIEVGVPVFEWKRINPKHAPVVVSNESVYVPTSEDVGHRLELSCKVEFSSDFIQNLRISLQNAGDINFEDTDMVSLPSPVAFTSVVQENEFEMNSCLSVRASYLENPPLDLRIMTYNILSEVYAGTGGGDMYPYCDPRYLATGFRMGSVAAELLKSNSDLICLQECDMHVFDRYLAPLMKNLGYSGYFTGKLPSAQEGCASFFRQDRIDVLKCYDLTLKEFIKSFPLVTELIKTRADVEQILTQKLGTVGQIFVIRVPYGPQNSRSKIMILANTHLFYHPNAGYVRLIQTEALVGRLFDMKAHLLQGKSLDSLELPCGMTDHYEMTSYVNMPSFSPEKLESSDIIVGLIGDLNSPSDTAVVEYLTR